MLFGSLRTVLAQQASRKMGSFRRSLSSKFISPPPPDKWSGDWQERDRRKKLEATIAKQREACANAVEARGDGHDPEVDPELGIVAARAACVPTFLVGLSPDARYDPRVLDARKRKIEADWNLALMAPSTGPVSQNKARWLKAKANLRRVAADARDDEEAKNAV